MDGAAREDKRREVAEREVRQRTMKKSWRHRCQTVLEPLVDMPWEHLADVWVEPGSTSARDSGESTGGGWEGLQVGDINEWLHVRGADEGRRWCGGEAERRGQP